MMQSALRLIVVICAGALALSASACAPQKRSTSTWDDIDYSKVRNRSARENDGSYRAPSVLSCVDDDLYNCSR